MASEASQSISLKIIVEKEKNRVVFAKANKDFVDVIFNSLTTQIGTVVSLTCEHFLKGEIGCLNNLYASIEKLDQEHLASEHKEILLHPRSAIEVYFRNLKLNLIYYQIDSCRCGNPIAFEVNLSGAAPQDGGVFIKPTVSFMVTDDF